MIFRFNVALLCLVWLPLSGCYYLQAAQGQMSLLAKRQPISRVLAKSDTSPQLRERLEYVQAARSFASQQLGLPDNKSYTGYVDLQRRYVSWNVFVAPKFSIEPRQWCFPIAGCVVYRGYFSEVAAERYARRLRMQGNDASVSGVPAYSTLGHFADPVLSSMMSWGDAQLAATLFHELAHQVVYVQGDSAFNEAFATVVETSGLQRWLTSLARSDEWQRWQVQRQRALEFSQLLLRTREDLRRLYASGVPVSQMAVRKQQRLGQLKFEYQQLKQQWQGYGGYDAWFDRPLSNADFIAIATYQRCVPNFEHLLDSSHGDLPSFYNEVKKLAHQEQLTRQRFCSEIGYP
ncbi:MAG: aminopeptidase [Steroidobacteraceae bacterium]